MPSAGNSKTRSSLLIWLGAAILFCLHQDFWLWDNSHLLLGFLPIGLGYHALFSILAASLWALAIRLAWPNRLESWASQIDDPESTLKSHAREDSA